MSNEFNEKNYSSKMDKSVQSFKKDISTLRTGRANTSMLDTIKVDVYGQLMPIEQLATISVPEARLISIQVWDKANTSLIEFGNSKIRFRNKPSSRWSNYKIKNSRFDRGKKKRSYKNSKKYFEKGKVLLEILEEKQMRN